MLLKSAQEIIEYSISIVRSYDIVHGRRGCTERRRKARESGEKIKRILKIPSISQISKSQKNTSCMTKPGAKTC